MEESSAEMSGKHSLEGILREELEKASTHLERLPFLSENEREDVLNEIYFPAIFSISSVISEIIEPHKRGYHDSIKDLKEIRALYNLFRASDNYSDLDLRYISSYKSMLEENPDIASKINQKLIDIVKKMEMPESLEIKFVLINAIMDSAGKKVKKPDFKKLKIKSDDLNDLLKAFEEDFDFLEISYSADAVKKASHGKEKELPASLSRKDAEIYFLERLRKSILDSVGPIGFNNRADFLYSHISYEITRLLPRTLNIADSSVEEFERKCREDEDDAFFDSVFLNKIFEKSRRTKLDLEISGKDRPFMFYRFNPVLRNMYVAHAGDVFMAGSGGRIKRLSVENARNCFMMNSSAQIEEMDVNKSGHSFMAGSWARIGKIKVMDSGENFMHNSYSKIGKLFVYKTGERFMVMSNAEIEKACIENSGDYLMLFSRAKINDLYIRRTGIDCMMGSRARIEKAEVVDAKRYLLSESYAKINELHIRDIGKGFMSLSHANIGRVYFDAGASDNNGQGIKLTLRNLKNRIDYFIMKISDKLFDGGYDLS